MLFVMVENLCIHLLSSAYMCRYAAHGYDRLSLRAQGVDWRTYNATRATVAAAAEGALRIDCTSAAVN